MLHKVPHYDKGDLRRMLLVLVAMEKVQVPTMVSIAQYTNIDRRTVTHLIAQAQEQAGVVIEKDGPVYKLCDWGPLFKKTGAMRAAEGALGNISVSLK